MSDFTKTSDSILTDDVENKLRKVQSDMINLIKERDTIDETLKQKREELTNIQGLLEKANIELDRVVIAASEGSAKLSEREEKIKQKESALDVYANALKEKEDKLNKYLAIFERMKDVVTK